MTNDIGSASISSGFGGVSQADSLLGEWQSRCTRIKHYEHGSFCTGNATMNAVYCLRDSLSRHEMFLCPVLTIDKMNNSAFVVCSLMTRAI